MKYNSESYLAIAGGLDGITRFVSITAKTPALESEAIEDQYNVALLGSGSVHLGGIESVAANPVRKGVFVSVGVDKYIHEWEVDPSTMGSAGIPVGGESRKKIKSTSYEIPAKSKTQGHFDKITDIRWIDSKTVLTGSYDHQAKMVDIHRKVEVVQWNNKHNVVTAVEHAGKAGVVIISGEDGSIRAFDDKGRDKNAVKVLRSHTKYVSDVKYHADSDHIFATVSFPILIDPFNWFYLI